MRAALFIAAMMLASPAVAQPDEREVRRRSFGPWVVTDVAESDGGQLVKIERRERGTSIIYQGAYWRGNGGVLLSAEVRIGECVGGDRPAPVPFGTTEPVEELRVRFRTYFAECGLPERRQAALLRELDRPYCLFRRWAADAAAAVMTENAEIIAYGTEETARPIPPDYPDCRV